MKTRIYQEDIFTSPHLSQCCGAEYSRVVVITDANVAQHYAQPLLASLRFGRSRGLHLITIPSGESTKSRVMKQSIEDQLFALDCGRDTLIIALGGGVVTDLAGFVAATYHRGIPIVLIPTSLLAMVDAAIGGKTGINTEYGKNTLGSFIAPKAVFIDINLLDTLPEKEYVSAFSEIVKHALIADAEYFAIIAEHIEAIRHRDKTVLCDIVARSCQIKSAIVAEDQKEHDKRAILNFGHTIAHALESASAYTLPHGEAVAIGIRVESYLSQHLGYLSVTDLCRIGQLLDLLSLPAAVPPGIAQSAVAQYLLRDKKRRSDKNRWVLLSRIGAVVATATGHTQGVDAEVIALAIDNLFQKASPL